MPVTITPKGSPKPKVPSKPVQKAVSPEDIQQLPDEQPVQLTAKQPVLKVIKQYKDGSSTETEEPLPMKTFTGPTANVGLSIGITRNLGNYESVKITVSLNMPCNPTEPDMEATFHEVHGWVDTRVELLNQEINQQLGQ